MFCRDLERFFDLTEDEVVTPARVDVGCGNSEDDATVINELDKKLEGVRKVGIQG